MSEKQVQFPDPIYKQAESLPPDFFRDALTQFMDLEVNAACNALYGERTAERQNSRNGVRPRDVETRLGTVTWRS